MKTRLTKLFNEFIESEQASGAVLILCIAASVIIANSPLGTSFSDFLHIKIGFEVERWINDGLMAVFFLLIGLEIRRELYVGELSDLKNATLPVFAAIGGMVTPALLHLSLNHGTETQSGFGIPVATDIAFTLGVLALLGKRVPVSLKVFVAALAIIDDLGAIVVIALFYAGHFSLLYLALCLGVFAGLLILNRLGVRRLIFYLVPGLVMWYFMLKSGIHPTLAGVLLAFTIPFARGGQASPSHNLEHSLQRPVAFLIVPLFAFANTGVTITGSTLHSLTTPNSLGIFAGLFFGKPIGITLFCLLAVGFRLSRLPDGVSWGRIIGAGFLCGIGFTMSVFITLLAFGNPEVIRSSKVAILLSSLLAGTTGYVILRKTR